MGEKALNTEHFSLQEYYRFDEAQEIKHEFERGKILAMSGGTLNHSRISRNISLALSNKTRGGDCEIFSADARVYIQAADSAVFPDVSAVCGQMETLENDTFSYLNPKLIVEVLSKSTGDYDRGGKFFKYRQIPSFEEYLLVNQYETIVDVFRKPADGLWVMETYTSKTPLVPITSLGIELSFEEIYENVTDLVKV